jgi:hypothetical protein
LTPETIEAGYVSPLIDLWSLDRAEHPHPREQDKVKQAREEFADRAVGKLNDGYTAEEYGRLCSLMFDQKDQLGIWL